MISPDTQHFMAERMAAQARSYPVDHAPLVSRPQAVVEVLAQALRSVAARQ